jgi:NADH dehydrogenase FAD-containing subunit
MRYRPLSVDEPFARRRMTRFPLRVIARRTGAEWVQDTLDRLDPGAQSLHTGWSQAAYDALLLAVGGTSACRSSTSPCSTMPTPTRPFTG